MIRCVFVYLCVIVSTVAAVTAGRLPLCLSVSYNCCSLIRLNSGQRNRQSILLSRSVIILVPFFTFFLPSNWWTAAQLNGGRLCWKLFTAHPINLPLSFPQTHIQKFSLFFVTQSQPGWITRTLSRYLHRIFPVYMWPQNQKKQEMKHIV